MEMGMTRLRSVLRCIFTCPRAVPWAGVLLALPVIGSIATSTVVVKDAGAKEPGAKDAGTLAQMSFASPDEAAAALIDATKQGDLKRMAAVLGPGSDALINSGDPYADSAARQKFVADYETRHKLVEIAAGQDVLDVGTGDWPLPIPVVQASGRWHFDSRAGAQQIIDRRIGRNEIAAIRVALTYVDAQRDYFKRSEHAGEYAQRLVSTPDQHDGLYWPATADGPESPFGPLVAQAVEEGYPGDIESGRQIPYQGYYFRILKAQGDNAPGGAKDYMENGRMTGGFALVAWPATYGSSGIMTFVVDQDGVVFQKNLGAATSAQVAAILRFNADVSWARVDVTSD
jgi:Protein of unknown function (DUF2950)